jgi:hypothetical protein
MAWWWLVLAACSRDLDDIEGFDLGPARSAVWASDPDTEQVAVIATDDRGDLCAQLDGGGPADATWVLAVWSTEPASYEADLDADGWVELTDGLIDDVFDGAGTVWVDDGNTLQVRLDLDFDGDRVKGSLRAEPCDVDLLAWIGAGG